MYVLYFRFLDTPSTMFVAWEHLMKETEMDAQVGDSCHAELSYVYFRVPQHYSLLQSVIFSNINMFLSQYWSGSFSESCQMSVLMLKL